MSDQPEIETLKEELASWNEHNFNFAHWVIVPEKVPELSRSLWTAWKIIEALCLEKENVGWFEKEIDLERIKKSFRDRVDKHGE